MNMLTGLRTLLFSSAAMKRPGMGEGMGAAPATGEADFAALLGGSMKGEGAVASDAPAAAQTDADPGKGDAVPLDFAPIAAVEEGAIPALPISPSKEGMEPRVEGKPKARAEKMPERIAPAQAVVEAIAAPGEGEAPVSDDKAEKVSEDASDASPLLTPPPLVPLAVAAPAPKEMTGKAEAVSAAAPVASMERHSAQPLETEGAAASPVAPVPLPAAENASEGTAASEVQANVAVPPVAEAVKESGKGSGKPSALLVEDGAAPVPPSDDALPPAAPAAKISRSEALSLLQMVREQFSRVPVEGVRAEAVAMPSPKNARDGKAMMVDLPAAVATITQPDGAGSAPAPLPQLTAAGASALPAAAPPSADLGASLGARVVDMGVSGQWIDGLARDIAGLAQNGAQGRFQINASQLGPVQVDIRQGADGAAVSLTVAHEAAELALKQDSDRLRLDAGLAAVRISDVRIERAPHVAEAARPDSAGQQPSGQQSSSQGAAAGWQAAERNGGQGHGQARENSASGLKGSADRAVINQKDADGGAGDVRRARYA
ncbi:MAG: flagellar hook-length control protein FliK [Sphingobium sp.]